MEIENEQKARKIAIWVIGIMTLIWIVLSVFSFTDSGDRVRPHTVDISFNGQSALKGKQVFQSYNCMDCHTIVGNGAYFAPDLTKINESSGPAWLRAYLGSPGTYPTQTIVNIQRQQLIDVGIELPADMDAYMEAYPGAKDRIVRRGGIDAMMPNLQFTAEEIDALIAYFIYTAKINTAGWPPKVIALPAVIEAEAQLLEEKSGLIRKITSVDGGDGDTASANLNGADLTSQFACVACHSTDGSEVIGPSFKGLFGSMVQLDNGQMVKADDDYLKRSILQPNEEIVNRFPKGVMPPFEGNITDAELDAIIDYLKTLK